MFLYVCIVVLCYILSVEHKSSTNGDLTCSYRTPRSYRSTGNINDRTIPSFSQALFPCLLFQDVGDVQLQGTRQLQPSDATQHTHFNECRIRTWLSSHVSPGSGNDTQTRDVTSPVTRVRPLKIMHSRSSFTQSELNTLTQLSGPPQNLRGLPACYSLTSRTFVHTATRPLVRQSLRPLVRQSLRPLVRRSLHPSHQSSSTDATLSYPQATRQPLQDHRGNSLHRSSTLSSSGRLRDAPSSFIVVTGGGVL